ncbi:uncharacterized protein KGF55_004670 [Candida pseudojiufengensis]|uniref:uncharacterized protein n=1 Tax=Candida pseudojiufengensis TaxID=497109 RepID=UPI002224ED90|nr:uncharacterized protein KGF55_004670 [Candida pseudojiufengensis]KAI5960378.1 hypothetical protein KGF55_004670 [Candida pseudojiufengensis]
MKISTSTGLAIIATASATLIEQQHQESSNIVARQEGVSAIINTLPKFQKRDGEPDLQALVDHINNYKTKRDAIDLEIIKRDYEIVTDVLTAINQTQLAPKILDYFVSSPTFKPIIINVLISVMQSGIISLQAVLDALVSSNLAVNLINDLISDCDLYVELFNIAKEVISDLANNVKDLIDQGVSSLITRDEFDDSLQSYIINEKRLDINFDTVVDNLLDSLYKSGLATSVVKDVLTNSNYLSFAVDLIKAMLANNLIDIRSIITALTQSGLISQLFRELLNFNTLSTVAETAFAAFAGQCSGGTTPTTGGTTIPTTAAGSITSQTVAAGAGSGSGSNPGPCKKRRRVRRRRSNY